MKTTIIFLCTLALSASLACAQAPSAKPEVRQLTVQPRAIPDSPLSHRLLPSSHQLTRGNAAPVWLTGMLLIAAQPQEWHDQLNTYQAAKIEQLADQDARQLIQSAESILDQLHIAARRDHCTWDHTWQEQGFDALLPHLGHMRTAARLLSLEARLAIAEQRWDDAIRALQSGFAMARHLDQQALLIQGLVAAAITNVFLDDVQLLIQQPDAPNLYWPLAILPHPTLDFATMMAQERHIAEGAFPVLHQARAAAMDPTAARTMLLALAYPGQEPTEDQIKQFEQDLQQLNDLFLPAAKAHLARQGLTDQQIDSMPTLLVILRYLIDDYLRQYDELAKWFHLPLWQRYPGLLRTERELQQAGTPNPLNALMQGVVRASWSMAKPDRYIAALQTIEAIRSYAAVHDGKLPEALSDLELPAATDPVTGQHLRYEATENGFTLASPSITGEPRDELRYEVTVK